MFTLTSDESVILHNQLREAILLPPKKVFIASTKPGVNIQIKTYLQGFHVIGNLHTETLNKILFLPIIFYEKHDIDLWMMSVKNKIE